MTTGSPTRCGDANLVRSPRWWELYRSWDTPTPPGFVVALRTYGLVFPTGPTALRLLSLAALVVTLLLLLRLLVDIAERRPVIGLAAIRRPGRRRRSMLIAAVAGCALVPLMSAFGIERTFVPYFVETAFSAALVLLCARLDRSPRLVAVLLAVILATTVVHDRRRVLPAAAAIYLLVVPSTRDRRTTVRHACARRVRTRRGERDVPRDTDPATTR